MAVAPFSSYERVNIGHGTLIAVWVTFGVASLVFWTRIVVQLNLGKRPGIDDYLMLAAWVCEFSAREASLTLTILRYRFYTLCAVRLTPLAFIGVLAITTMI